MFQHYSVFQFSPPRADNVLLSFSLSGSVYASLAFTARMYGCVRACVSLFTPSCCVGMGSVGRSFHKQNLLLLLDFSVALLWREALFRGPTLIAKMSFVNAND